MSRTLRTGLVAVALLAGSLGVTSLAPSAAQALSCSGSGCNGKNPTTYGCAADATTASSHTYSDNASGGTFGMQVVQLRHSNHCNASWARVITTAGGTASVTYGQAYMSPYKTSTLHTRFNAGSISSNMRAGSSVTACGKSNWNSGAVVKTFCLSAG